MNPLSLVLHTRLQARFGRAWTHCRQRRGSEQIRRGLRLGSGGVRKGIGTTGGWLRRQRRRDCSSTLMASSRCSDRIGAVIHSVGKTTLPFPMPQKTNCPATQPCVVPGNSHVPVSLLPPIASCDWGGALRARRPRSSLVVYPSPFHRSVMPPSWCCRRLLAPVAATSSVGWR